MKFREKVFLLITLLIVFSFHCGVGIRVFGFSQSVNLKSSINYQLTVIIDQTIGGSDLDYAYSVVTTSDGGFALSGYTYSNGAGGSDMWLVKTNAMGEIDWEKTFGGSNLDYGFSIIATSDGGYILAGGTESYGAGSSDMLVVKTDAQGTIVWNQTYGGTAADYSFSILRASDEGYVIVGRTESYGAGLSDMWLVKIKTLGEIEWNCTYGGVSSESGDDAVVTSDGGYALVGGTESYGEGNSDMWIVKTDDRGQVEWNKTYGGTNEDRAMAVITTSDGVFVIAGLTRSYGSGNRDMWMVKTDASGLIEWNRTFGGQSNDYADSIIGTSDGGYALAGRTESFGSGSEDMWLVKTNSSGQVEWNQTFGGSEADVAYSLMETSENEYVLVGRTASQESGNSDLWLLKIKMGVAISKTTNFPIFGVFFFPIMVLTLLNRKIFSYTKK